MSERINIHDNRATIRWKLLTTASAVVLTAYISSTGVARAEDGDRPTLWIELGGQMEQMQGLSSPFTAPFMTAITPTPDVLAGNVIIDNQRPPRFAFGGEGKISFQPEDSDWIFSAGIRYGRSHAKRHVHHQTSGVVAPYYTFPYHGIASQVQEHLQAFLESTAPSAEHHLVADFSVGRDVGIGLLGRDGSSTLNAGVRLVDLSESSSLTVYARPQVGVVYTAPKYVSPNATFNGYTMRAAAARSFNGLGPSLSWNASAGLAGNKQDGELMLDWSVNAALLFGRQKAKTAHSTTATRFGCAYGAYYASCDRYLGTLYPSRSVHNTRSRRVTVPNVGGSVGLSVKYPNVKVSIGYRYDTFLKAMDTGIDVAKKSNLTFNGPYASISIGLGD